jgi:alpha-mannosidase
MDNDGTKDAFMDTHPMQRFISYYGKDNGISVLSNDFLEYEILKEREGSIALTMLRSVPVKICAEFRAPAANLQQKGAQCFGEHSFEYAIFPHSKDVQRKDLFKMRKLFCNRPVSYQTCKNTDPQIKQFQSLLKIDNDQIEMVSLKKAEKDQSLVLRLYNLSDSQQKLNIKFIKNAISACHLNLNEEILKNLEIGEKGEVITEVEPHKIYTVSVKFD